MFVIENIYKNIYNIILSVQLIFIFSSTISYIGLTNELKLKNLSIYLLYYNILDWVFLIIDFWRVITPHRFPDILYKISYKIYILRIISIIYVILNYNLFGDCGEYKNYMACIILKIIYANGIISYTFGSCLCMLEILTLLIPDHKEEIKGLTKEAISYLPITFIPPTDNICPICHEDAKETDEWKVLKCQHKFHSKCISEWLEINNTCPYCRCEQN